MDIPFSSERGEMFSEQIHTAPETVLNNSLRSMGKDMSTITTIGNSSLQRHDVPTTETHHVPTREYRRKVRRMLGSYWIMEVDAEKNKTEVENSVSTNVNWYSL